MSASRVVIIGAGPGGLALAQGLHRAGIEVAVHERDAALDSRGQGYRVALHDDGWQSLRACLPERVRALAEATGGEPLGPATICDTRLDVVSTWGSWDDDGSAPPRPVDRAVLRHVLIEGLTDHVSFGRQFSRFEQRGDEVRVVFADGTEDVGDVVVGADGAFSAVRKTLHPELGFVRSELVAAMGRTPLTERFASLSRGGDTMIQGPGLNFAVGPMVFHTPPAEVGLPAAESYLRWLLLLPPDHPAALAARRQSTGTVTGTGHDAQEVVLELTEGWHPLLRELVEHTSAHNSWIVTPKLLDRPMPSWDTERVTLLGDAAHLTIPSGGNGLSTALRDAATLLRRLTGDDDTVDALRAYQEEMLVYGQAAVDAGVAQQRRVVPQPAGSV